MNEKKGKEKNLPCYKFCQKQLCHRAFCSSYLVSNDSSQRIPWHVCNVQRNPYLHFVYLALLAFIIFEHEVHSLESWQVSQLDPLLGKCTWWWLRFATGSRLIMNQLHFIQLQIQIPMGWLEPPCISNLQEKSVTRHCSNLVNHLKV